MPSLSEIFPPFGLSVAAGSMELRVLRDDDLPELVDLVAAGVADPALPMPFRAAWHEEPLDLGGPRGFPTESLRWWWSQRAACAPDEWWLALVVRVEGRIVGLQDVHAVDFPLTRTVETGSWLGREHHGRGLGTLMRRLAVGLALDELDAECCVSAYIEGNAASAAVSRKVGYVDGERVRIVQRRRGERTAAWEQRVVVTRDTYVRPEEPVRIEGAAAVRRFLGIER